MEEGCVSCMEGCEGGLKRVMRSRRSLRRDQ